MGKESYTFNIIPEEYSPNIIFRLVVGQDNGTDTPTVNILALEKSEEFIEQERSGDIETVRNIGKLYTYPFDGFANKTAKGDCPPNDITNDPTDDGNNDDSSSSGGGGGGTSGDGTSGPGPGSGDGGDTGTGGEDITIEWTCGCSPEHDGGNDNDGCDCKKPDVIVINFSKNSGAGKSAKGGDCLESDGPIGLPLSDDDDDVPPCKQFQKLQSDSDFKNKMKELAQKAMTDNKETGYKLKSNVDGYDYEKKEGNEGELGIKFNLADNEKLDGFVHNHYNAPNSLSVFSPEDLYSLYNMLDNGHINSTGSFVYAVTTSDGTNYALRIKSKLKFLNFGRVALEGLQNDDNNTLGIEYAGGSDSKLKPYGIKDTNSNALNERNFAKLLLLANSGLELYRSTDNFESWEKVESDTNGNITYTKC